MAKVEPYLRDMYREIEIQSQLFDQDREVEQLHWGGGTPGYLSHSQSEQLMREISTHFPLRSDNRADYSIEIDPRVMEKDSIKHLRNLGFNRISIGVQDFDERVQKAVNRIQSLETTARIVNDARRHDIRSINIDLIYGLPKQNLESFSSTLDRVVELGPDRVALYNYAHLPNRFPPQRRIKEKDLPDSAEKLSIQRNAVEKLCGAGYEYLGMDHFARPEDELAMAQRNGSLHRNFQGYSAHAQCDSIGFGVSAISQVADNFSQNTTSLDAYHNRLENGRMPLVRGFYSKDDDLLRREIIQSLICHFFLDTALLGRKWGIDFASLFAHELSLLQQMQQDGLLELGDGEITILDGGRLLVRNICMVFDRYRPPGNNRGFFSRTI